MVKLLANQTQLVIVLMNRLRYPQKFALISLVFGIPLALITGLLLGEIHERMEFTQREIEGNLYRRPLRQVWQAALTGELSVVISKHQNQAQTNLVPIQTAIANLAEVEQALGSRLKTQQHFQRLRDAVKTLSPIDNRQNGFIFSNIVELTSELRIEVGNNSNLVLDPDLDSYYLMDAGLLKMPVIQRLLNRIQLIYLKAAQTQRITLEQKGELVQLSAILKSQVQSLARSLKTSFRQDPRIQSQLRRSLTTFELLIQPLLTDITNQVIPRPDYINSAEDLINRIHQFSFIFVDQIDQQLGLLLYERISGFSQRRWSVIGLILVVFVILAYLFSAFYLSVMRTVNQLETVAKQMSLGQFDQEFAVETRDELGMVVHSFNRVARALQRAEQKYRSIFEHAIEGIFQTTVDGQYLSANQALAKIYGYGNPTELVTNLNDIGTTLYVDPNRRAEFMELIDAYGRVSEFESQVYRRDRSIIWISEAARAVRDDQDRIIYYEGTVQDISDRKIAEQELELANAKISSLNQKLKQENLRMSSELEITRKLQSMILPKLEELSNLEGIQIAGFMEPASEVGGDYYDVLQHNGRIKIAIGDVTGHGLESGLLMVMVQTAVRTLIESNQTDTVKFMDILNRTVYGNVQRMNSDKNLSLSLLDYARGKLFLSGQHEEMILVRTNGKVERIDTMDLGFPIGLEQDISGFVDRIYVELNPGDVVVLYTDGIPEAENAAGAYYGIERLCEIVKQHRHSSSEEIKQAVISDLRTHIGRHTIYDDITLVVLKQS
ncbi:MAG: SpoIIE family protein phosphatase [Pseudanabaenaceae cyanobacterium bins.68]|nr:SpoIIE family protein phosphatase [Pseudanabaenaceae cyanobacterium bins.68]